MDPIGFSLSSPPQSPFLCSPLHAKIYKAPNFPPNFKKSASKITVSCMETVQAGNCTTFGFKNLMATFKVDVHRAEGRPLNVPLIAPFTIATSRLDKVENVAIRIELSNGCVGWGEAPILPFVTAEDQPTALAKAEEACEYLRQNSGKSLCLVLGEIGQILPGHQFASSECFGFANQYIMQCVKKKARDVSSRLGKKLMEADGNLQEEAESLAGGEEACDWI